MKKKHALYASMLKIGCIGFGGGSALIPVIEKEVVEEYKIVDKAEYDKAVVVASITPGALPVEIAAGVGQKQGVRGMFFAALLMALPGALLTVAMLTVLSGLNQTLVRQIEFVSIGITPFILYLLTKYIFDVIKAAKKESILRMWKVFVIFGGVFLLAGGKTLFRLFGISGEPPFALSTVAILGISCFGIIWTSGVYTWKSISLPLLCIGLFVLCTALDGQMFVYGKLALGVLMACLTLIQCYRSFSIGKSKTQINWKPLRKEVSVWILWVILFSIPAVILHAEHLWYLLRGLMSSFISFGGGDAYLTVADGMFVSTGMITESQFYGRLVSLVNVLPGSILCKTLTGVGYLAGYNQQSSILEGCIVAAAGFACSVAASGGVYSVVAFIYSYFEQIDIFQILRRWIRPIISGLLLNVMFSLINQGIAAGANFEISKPVVLCIIGGIYALNMYLATKKKAGNLLMVILSVAVSLGVCNVLYLMG